MLSTAPAVILSELVNRLFWGTIAPSKYFVMFNRSFATVAENAFAIKQRYKVIVIGGGSAGIAVASQIAKSSEFAGKKDILVVDPADKHYYQPLWASAT